MSKKKKVQTIKTVTTKYLLTYFIDISTPDTDVVDGGYIPDDECVIDIKEDEEVL